MTTVDIWFVQVWSIVILFIVKIQFQQIDFYLGLSGTVSWGLN